MMVSLGPPRPRQWPTVSAWLAGRMERRALIRGERRPVAELHELEALLVEPRRRDLGGPVRSSVGGEEDEMSAVSKDARDFAQHALRLREMLDHPQADHEIE